MTIIYCTNELFNKDTTNVNLEKIHNVHGCINEKYQICTAHLESNKHVVVDDNLDLLSQIIQQNTLELTIFKSNAVNKGMVYNPVHIKTKSQLNSNVTIIKIDLTFLEAP